MLLNWGVTICFVQSVEDKGLLVKTFYFAIQFSHLNAV